MRIFLIFLIVLINFSGFSQTRKLNAETNIGNVTIFSSGARVQRTAAVNIQSGRTEISFPGLSNQLDQQTVQLKADANITLLSVQSTKDFLTVRKIEEEEKKMDEIIDLFIELRTDTKGDNLKEGTTERRKLPRNQNH